MNIFNKKPFFFAAISVLFLIVLLFVFREFAFDTNKLMLNSDQLNGLGSRILRAQELILTEWDDSRLGGVPTIDALFADAYHPLVLVQFLTDPARAVGIKFILTIWVAFMSAFLLAWNLTKNKWWGALLGLLYAFSPEYFTYIYGGHDGKMMVFAIAPLALLSIRKIIREAKNIYVIVLALSIAWMILGSHLQLTYMFLWGAGLYTLYEIIFHCDGLKTKGKRIGLTSIGLAFGLALSAFQVIPPYMYTTTQSVRGENDHTNYGHASSWCLHQEEMMQMILPGFIGVDVYKQDEKTGDLNSSSFVNINMQEYRAMQESGAKGSPFYWGHNSFKLDSNNAGTLLTFLGFLCLFLPQKRRWACFWGLGCVLALSYGMGIHSPIFKWWYYILPGAKNFRAPGMSMFWLPLLLVMMASPVLKTFSDNSIDALKKQKALVHGALMFVILLILVVIARYNWTLFISPFGLIVSITYALACILVINLDDNEKTLTLNNIIESIKNKASGSSRFVQISILIGFTFVGLFLMSGQEFLKDPIVAPYFKPLDELTMNATASKIIPGFLLAIAMIVGSLFIIKSKLNIVKKTFLLAAIALIELFFINGIFVQNIEKREYIQNNNPVIAALKAPYKNDSLNIPRVLSLTRTPSLSGNIFPQYNMRNASGIHDNELANYRKFRGSQQNENYLINIDNPEEAHPFLDLMNIGAIIFDSRQGTTYMPIETAMGEAYLYSEYVVMNDDDAILTLKTKSKIRKSEKLVEQINDSISTDSLTSNNFTTNNFEKELKNKIEDSNSFYYREKVILSEIPQISLNGEKIQGEAKLIEKPKMDTQIFKVNSNHNAIMVVAGNYHPYWKAYVNDKPVKVYKAFGNLRAIEIPKGTSIVRMEYRSSPLHICLKISFVTLILLIITSIILLRKKNND